MILVDGCDTVGLAFDDRGLAYGDGVFRTLEVRSGVARQWRRHVAKLAADCAVLGIVCPDEARLRSDVLRISRTDADCTLKIMITRGSGQRGYRYTRDAAPRRILMSASPPGYPRGYVEDGVKVRRCALKLAPQPALAGVKHLNRLENVLARAEWDDPEIAEGLLLDIEDNVIGGTMTNLFVVSNGTLVTPKLDRCGVAGVTRDRVLDAAVRAGMACRVARVRWKDVISAEEVFLVNSLAGAWPVSAIDGVGRAPGPVVRQVQRWLDADDT